MYLTHMYVHLYIVLFMYVFEFIFDQKQIFSVHMYTKSKIKSRNMTLADNL